MNLKALSMGAAVTATMAAAAPANASIIYQSTPDLTVAPSVNAWCSQCYGDGQSIGQQFSLATGATANSVSFAVDSYYYWPTSVTVGFYQDNGGTVGNVVSNQTFSSFVSDVSTGNGTDVVTVDVGSVALSAGNYLLFLTNPNNLAIPGYSGIGSGGQVFIPGGYSTDPLTGDGYDHVGGYDSAVSISSVPESSTWAMMGLGFAGLAFAGFRARRSAVAVA